MNSYNVIGRLTKDPELKTIPGTGNSVTNIVIAVKNPSKPDNPNYIPVVIWGKQAENTCKYTRKGSLLGVRGRLESRNYEAKDGTRRIVIEVTAEEIDFLSKNPEKESAPSNNNYNSNNNYSTSYNVSGYDQEMTPVDDGDIPF